MRKFLLKAIFATAIAFVAGYNVYYFKKDVVLSDLALANVEALAGDEWKDEEKISCMTFIVSPTPEELSQMAYPVVVCCQPCGNLVIAKQASGSSSCTYYKP